MAKLYIIEEDISSDEYTVGIFHEIEFCNKVLRRIESVFFRDITGYNDGIVKLLARHDILCTYL